MKMQELTQKNIEEFSRLQSYIKQGVKSFINLSRLYTLFF